jgi:alpha-D-ribose 1-methylphosphonate 5-triphosphate synthase subunit PhnH
MTMIPTLTPRAAREQTTFRTLLSSMSRPGSVSRLDLDGANPLLVIAEALVDHEVTFAVAPERRDLTEAILRQTGSHVAGMDVAQYVFCDADSLGHVLTEAADGTWEYPDAGATVICLVPAISEPALDSNYSPSPLKERGLGGEEALVLSGPGIRDTATVYVDGFRSEARRAFTERNAMRPLGLDLVLVTTDGALVSLTRYTSLQGEE